MSLKKLSNLYSYKHDTEVMTAVYPLIAKIIVAKIPRTMLAKASRGSEGLRVKGSLDPRT